MWFLNFTYMYIDILFITIFIVPSTIYNFKSRMEF